MNKINKVRLHCCSHETSCSSEVMTLERLEQKKAKKKKKLFKLNNMHIHQQLVS